ncbi:MAG: hypothetical protein LBQ58_12005 [Synergistaceae bacterium]|nr:hypothetical protein [Synergistaceae bacterium]
MSARYIPATGAISQSVFFNVITPSSSSVICAHHDLDVVHAISSRVEYSYTLGFNNSVIRLDRRKSAIIEG